MSLKHGPLNHSRLVTRNLRVSNRRGWNALVFFLQGTCEFEVGHIETLLFILEDIVTLEQGLLKRSRLFGRDL